MATKSDSDRANLRPYWRSCAALWLALSLGLFLSACGLTPTKDQAPSEASATLTLQPTKQYLPMRRYDNDGAVVPFEATPNPYLNIKGRIDKEAVVKFIEARRAYKSKNFDKAEPLLTAITEIDEHLSGPWVLLGRIAVEREQHDRAIEHFRQAIAINPLNVNAYLPLAKRQREAGDFVRAQNTYAKALAVWRDFPEAHLNLAILYDIYLNDPLQAQQHMEAYQFLTPERDEQVAQWLKEIQARTGIEPNLYIGSSSTSQIDDEIGDKTDS